MRQRPRVGLDRQLKPWFSESMLRHHSPWILPLVVACHSQPTAKQPETGAPVLAGRPKAAPGPVDEAFRRDFAARFFAQVDAENWAAFLPRAGTVLRTGPMLQLGDGSISKPTSVRACAVEGLLRGDVPAYLKALTTQLRDPKNTAAIAHCTGFRCDISAGEMGYNGEAQFQLEGDRVVLSDLARRDGGAVSPELQALQEQWRKTIQMPARCGL